jgi:hypothetical protein
MSKADDSVSRRDLEPAATRVYRAAELPGPLGLRSDPFSSEEVDARIRRFFANPREQRVVAAVKQTAPVNATGSMRAHEAV